MLSSLTDDPMAALAETRHRFIAGFPARCDSIALLVDTVSALGPRGPVAALRQIVHRLTGLAGTVGFPTISERASELEQMLLEPGLPAFDAGRARTLVDEIRAAFVGDLATPPAWLAASDAPARKGTILIAEDDPEQCSIIVNRLESSGYVPIAVTTGDAVLEAARQHRPDVVLLDVSMPGTDGYTACRLLKSDPDLARTIVVVITVRGSLNDRTAAFTLGADDFLTKPVDLNELVIRIQHLLERAREPHRRGPAAELDFEAFLTAARDALRERSAAVALVRLPPGQSEEAAAALREELRRRDLIGRYDRTHLVLLLPGMQVDAARARLSQTIAEIGAAGVSGIAFGVVDAEPGTPMEAVMARADEALAEARQAAWASEASGGEKPAMAPGGAGADAGAPSVRTADDAQSKAATIVLAEDDPEVVRILDAQMRAVSYRTIAVHDGEAVVQAVRDHAPDLLVLDLMLPKLTGFDVLTRLRSLPSRPRVVVLSSRGREEDVTRAFQLGADDYITKPFSPQELLARIARLLR